MMISIVMPAHDSAQFIAAAIESCLEQVCDFEFELIVVDDGSGDETREVVSRFLSDSRVRLLTQPNRGAGAARNLAIAASTGDGIAFLDSDDCYSPGALQAFGDCLRRAPSDIALHYAHYRRVNAQGRAIAEVRVRPPMSGSHLYQQFLLPGALPVLTSTVLVARRALEQTGGFDERFLRCQDLELWTRIIQHFRIALLDASVCYRRIHADQVTANSGQIAFWRDQANLAFLDRVPFRDFCGTHDPVAQSMAAERFGDLMLQARLPLVRTARRLFDIAYAQQPGSRLAGKIARLAESPAI